MVEFPILTIIIALPTVGALLLMLLNSIRISDHAVKVTAFIITTIELLVSLYMWSLYDPQNSHPQFTEKLQWMDGLNLYYSLGVDGISIFFILLTAFLMPICILSSWNNIEKRVKEYMIYSLLLETFIMGVFCATDTILFFVFFEAVLIPIFFIIGIWGGEKRKYAAMKYFLYSLFASIFLLLSLIFIYYHTKTTYIFALYDIVPTYTLGVQKWLWIGFFIAFAVKVPMCPFHTWLPDAYVQAPTATTALLAGVLKLGVYGFLRFSLPMLPDASHYYADLVLCLSAISVIYASLIALMQEDIKRLIAYSSIAHMGFVTAGIFSLNQQGIEGSIFQIITYGMVSAGLFICAGTLHDRMHTMEIKFYNGLTSLMPKFAFVLMILTLSAVGLPGTSGFIGEFLILLGTFEANKIYATLITTGMVFGVTYMLWFYAKIMFGEIKTPQLLAIHDLNYREWSMLIPIVFLVIFLGIYPKMITDNIKNSVKPISNVMIFDKLNNKNE